MSTTSNVGGGAFPGWDPANCTKTEDCPPRCPRFVDKQGCPLLVRPYADREFEQLVDFYDAYPTRHRSMSLPPVARPRVESWLDRLVDSGKNIVAFDDDQLVGHIAYTPQDATEPELIVFVDEDHRLRGLGTELCRHVLAYAAADGHEGVRLNVDENNEVALSVYRSLGFEVIDREDRLVEMRRTFDEFPVVEPIAQLPN